MPKSKHSRKGKRRQPKANYGVRTKTLSGRSRPPRDPLTGEGSLFGFPGLGGLGYTGISPQALYETLMGRPTDTPAEDVYCHRCDEMHENGVSRLEWEEVAADVIIKQMNPESLSPCGPTGHQQAAWDRLMFGGGEDTCGVCGKETRFQTVAGAGREIVTDHAIETLERNGAVTRIDHHVIAYAPGSEIEGVTWRSIEVDEALTPLEETQ